MQLPESECKLFYKLYAALLCYVNERLEIIPGELKTPEEYERWAPAKRAAVRDALFQRRELIDEFVAENPFKLSRNELDIVESWKHAVVGKFTVSRFLKKYTVFLHSENGTIPYGVLGLVDPLPEVIGSYVPRLVGAVLLPFQGKIIYDGLVSMPDVVITFGAGAKRMFNDSYRAAKARYGIVTSLPMETKPMKGRSGTARRKKAAGSREVYQFKLTLKDVHPAVWRRIQVEDCTLDELHRHIQASMGWMNCHLYQFEIGGELYGDPGLLNDGWSAADVVDSGRTKLSKLLPKEGRSFRFRYEYDFGDGWMHDVLFERTVDAESGARFPVCVAGARACPPEDCGGAFGYEGLLEAIEDSNHPDHEDVLDWVGGRFDPEKFHPEQATKLMRQGL